LETTTDLSPVQFLGGFGNQKCTFSVVQNRNSIAHGAPMELLQFSRRSTTPSGASDIRHEVIAPRIKALKRKFQYGKNMATADPRGTAVPFQW
jgi:hypothetical protein